MAAVHASGQGGPSVMQQLQACAPQDVQELLPHLQARGDAYARDAVQQLTARGEAEARAMREILDTQQGYPLKAGHCVPQRFQAPETAATSDGHARRF